MDQHAASPDYNAQRTALRSAGISDGLAGVIVDALREHDAAGRPPITLPSPEGAVNEHPGAIASEQDQIEYVGERAFGPVAGEG